MNAAPMTAAVCPAQTQASVVPASEAAARSAAASDGGSLVTMLRAQCPAALVRVGSSVGIDLAALAGARVEVELPAVRVLERGVLS